MIKTNILLVFLFSPHFYLFSQDFNSSEKIVKVEGTGTLYSLENRSQTVARFLALEDARSKAIGNYKMNITSLYDDNNEKISVSSTAEWVRDIKLEYFNTNNNPDGFTRINDKVVGEIKQKDIFSNLKFGITNLKSNDLLSGSILYDESRYEFLFNSSTSGYLTILEKIGDHVSILYPDRCEISKQQKLIKANVNYKFFCDNSEYEFCINECNGGWVAYLSDGADEIISEFIFVFSRNNIVFPNYDNSKTDEFIKVELEDYQKALIDWISDQNYMVEKFYKITEKR